MEVVDTVIRVCVFGTCFLHDPERLACRCFSQLYIKSRKSLDHGGLPCGGPALSLETPWCWLVLLHPLAVKFVQVASQISTWNAVCFLRGYFSPSSSADVTLDTLSRSSRLEIFALFEFLYNASPNLLPWTVFSLVAVSSSPLHQTE